MTDLTDTLAPGTVIQDTYKITKLLGEGGMGATFAGINLATDHKVAIKVISAAFAENSRAVDLFKREANLLRTIQHEAVVRYETTLQDRKGRLYLVMEMLDGQPLSYYVEKGARLSSDDVLKLGRRLAGGIDAIAAIGTVHRDIAPDNIFVPDDDIQSAKLIDFGLASNTVGTEKSILGTDFAGKFSYSAPEQLGLFDNAVSIKTDAYALGLVLMKIAGLQVPGEGKGLAAGPARRENLDIPAGQVSPALQTVLTQLLQADPKDRPAPLVPVFEAAMANDGDMVVRSPKTEINIDKVAQQQAKAKSRGPMIAGLAAVGVIVLAAIAYFALPQIGDGGATGDSEIQGERAQGALDAADPLAEIRTLISEGTDESLNAAFGALLAFGRDAGQSDASRIEALLTAAEMADPATHADVATPFAAPDGSLARRIYADAAALGSDRGAAAAARLEND